MTTIDPAKFFPGMLPPFRVTPTQITQGNKENAPQSAQPQAIPQTLNPDTITQPTQFPAVNSTQMPKAPVSTQANAAAALSQLAPNNASYYHQTLVQQMGTSNDHKGRKRTINLVNGENIDLNNSFAVSPQVIEAMRQRIFQLEDEVEALRQPPAKRARTDPGAATSCSSGSSSAAAASTSGGKPSTVGDEKKQKMQLKKIFDQLKKDCKSDNCKFQGSAKTIKIDEVFEQTEFNAIFMGKGHLIQPTPENKPNSVVTIIHFENQAHINDLFGGELKSLKGNRWTKGGFQGHRLGFFGGGGSNFAKSVKTGSCDVDLHSIEVNYSKSTLKCSMKFLVAEAGYNPYSSYSGWDSD
ncbi:hypothetical protein GYMLUDRAFT_68238 [Collybiopsis luxurians FD-317 M1]|nr:hypothetical protein GYMLUDRAFT_68238 [Collybiopsis luxurians FD-317 M1]